MVVTQAEQMPATTGPTIPSVSGQAAAGGPCGGSIASSIPIPRPCLCAARLPVLHRLHHRLFLRLGEARPPVADRAGLVARDALPVHRVLPIGGLDVVYQLVRVLALGVDPQPDIVGRQVPHRHDARLCSSTATGTAVKNRACRPHTQVRIKRDAKQIRHGKHGLQGAQ